MILRGRESDNEEVAQASSLDIQQRPAATRIATYGKARSEGYYVYMAE